MIPDENRSNAVPMGNTHTAQAVTTLPDLRIASLFAKIPAPILLPPMSPLQNHKVCLPVKLPEPILLSPDKAMQP